MKESLHCRKGFVSAWFLMILMYVCVLTAVLAGNLSRRMQTVEKMEAYEGYFIQEAQVMADIRCRLKEERDEEGRHDFSPYAYDEEQNTVTVCFYGDYPETLVVILNAEETYISSFEVIR